MADVTATNTPLKGNYSRKCNVILWETLTSTNADGSSVEVAGAKDLTFQIIGTFDSATVVLQGSNDGSTWATLADAQGNAISKTSAALETVLEIPRYVRPSTSGGAGSQDLDAYLLASF